MALIHTPELHSSCCQALVQKGHHAFYEVSENLSQTGPSLISESASGLMGGSRIESFALAADAE